MVEVVSGVTCPEFRPWLCHLLAVWHFRHTHLTCKTGKVVLPTAWVVVRIKVVTHACWVTSVVSDFNFQLHGLYPARLMCPCRNTGVGCHTHLQGIFLTQGSNPHLLHLLPLAGRFFTTSITWEDPPVEPSVCQSSRTVILHTAEVMCHLLGSLLGGVYGQEAYLTF